MAPRPPKSVAPCPSRCVAPFSLRSVAPCPIAVVTVSEGLLLRWVFLRSNPYQRNRKSKQFSVASEALRSGLRV